MYDAIIVGARCAGAPTAMLLARRGHRVLLVDRAQFPSDVVSAHLIRPSGVLALRRWGLLDKVAGSGCPPLDQMTVELDGHLLQGAPAPVGGVARQYCVRRPILDSILVDAAVEAGVDFRDDFTVTDLWFDGNRVAGVLGRSRSHGETSASARMVIGADGLHSMVAEAVGARRYETLAALTFSCYAYWSDVSIVGGAHLTRDQRTAFVYPTNDELACIGVQWPIDRADLVRSDMEHHYLAALQSFPALTEVLQDATQVTPIHRTADVPNFFRQAWGAGWALVGDAGCHQDPYLARGIADAFRDADLLADAIDAHRSARWSLDDALADYESKRNAAAAEGYALTRQLATLKPPPEQFRHLLTEAARDRAALARALGVLAGTVSVPDSVATVALAIAEPDLAAPFAQSNL